MGEGVAMRHTFNQRAEDAEELGPQEGAPLGGEGLDPSPRALAARTTLHTQIDVAPLLEDMGSFRIPDRCPPDRAPPRRAALRSRRGSSDAPSPGQDLEGRDKGAKSTGRPCHMSPSPHAPELRLAECSSNRQCNRFSKGRGGDLRGNSSSPITQQALAAPSPGMATCGAARARRGRRAHRPAA